jgi:hypothetical protein
MLGIKKSTINFSSIIYNAIYKNMLYLRIYCTFLNFLICILNKLTNAINL